MLKSCRQSLGYPSVTQIIYILKWLTFVTNTYKIVKTCHVCVCITHGKQICMYIQLLVICQYAYKFLPKYLQSISIFFRLSFYIAFSWLKGHMETIKHMEEKICLKTRLWYVYSHWITYQEYSFCGIKYSAVKKCHNTEVCIYSHC